MFFELTRSLSFRADPEQERGGSRGIAFGTDKGSLDKLGMTNWCFYLFPDNLSIIILNRFIMLKIITEPNPILRQKAIPFDWDKLNVAKLKKWEREMIRLMYAQKGIGLAATQVSLPWRFCVIGRAATDHITASSAGGRRGGTDWFLINPEIIARSSEMHTLLEGCLSCPKVERPVARAIWVKVRAQDITGKNLEFDAENLSARVIQHELDHLDGILIIDK